MIEIYRNSTEFISHTVYDAGGPADADLDAVTVVVRNVETNEVWNLGAAETLELGRYRIRLPYAATANDGVLKASWSYALSGEPVTREETINVVTPYVSLDEITNQYPQLYTKSYEELRHMERRVRLMIDKITGQSFGTKTKAVELSGETTHALTDRLYHVHYYTVNGAYGSLDALNLSNDGWLVQVTYPPGYYNVKSDTFLSRRNGAMTVVLHGSFGWPNVPNDINLAALMLIGDYFCNDAIYRQRGVQAVRAADWRLDFNDKAFEGTGNLDVDSLLGNYVAYNMVII